MNEEVLNQEIQPDTEQKEPSSVDPIEQRAREMGWRPLEEFNGAEEDFIDAKEFVRRKPLFDKIEAQGKHLKQLTRALEDLKTHYTKVRETEFNRALQALRQERKEAVAAGDGEKFEQVDAQIKSFESAAAELKEEQNKPVIDESIPQEFQAWKTRNRWYDDDSDMRDFADTIGLGYHNKGKSVTEVLALVEKAVKKQFPEKFKNPNKESAPPVDVSKGTSRGRSNDIELTDIERQMMNTLVRSGVMTKEEYLNDLRKVKGMS